jgi:hypothetical protein
MTLRPPFSCGDALFVFGTSVELAVEMDLVILTCSRIRIGGARLWGNPSGLPASGRSRDSRIMTADGPHAVDRCVEVQYRSGFRYESEVWNISLQDF